MKIGDLVTRNSYNNDLLFVITSIQDNTCYLKGVNIRLIADAPMEDLKYCEGCDEEDLPAGRRRQCHRTSSRA